MCFLCHVSLRETAAGMAFASREGQRRRVPQNTSICTMMSDGHDEARNDVELRASSFFHPVSDLDCSS